MSTKNSPMTTPASPAVMIPSQHPSGANTPSYVAPLDAAVIGGVALSGSLGGSRAGSRSVSVTAAQPITTNSVTGDYPASNPYVSCASQGSIVVGVGGLPTVTQIPGPAITLPSATMTGYPLQQQPSGVMSNLGTPSMTCSPAPPQLQYSGSSASLSLFPQGPNVTQQQPAAYAPPCAAQCGGFVPGPGMLYPSTQPTPMTMTVPGIPNTLMYFNPQGFGYTEASGGYDPRQGYPLVYPYVPLPEKEKIKKKKGGCC